MEFKTTVVLFVIAITAIGMIATSTFVVSHEASAKKSCESKKYSHCKGDKGWYTKKGHHHCFKSENGCVESEYHKGK